MWMRWLKATSIGMLTCCLLGLPATTSAEGPKGGGQHVAQLRIEPTEGGFLAWADNLLPGPIEVRLESTGGSPLASTPALPARASVPAHGSALVAQLDAQGIGRNGLMRLSLSGTPGSSNARPVDVEYGLPLHQARRIDQGFEGSFSHNDDQNRYALDFAVDVGTPVLAARTGIVMQVEAGFRSTGSNYARDGMRANFVRILHEDGSMALYAHLASGGASVRVGQAVVRGERIGRSGNTGYSTAPHLHFVVQVNRGGSLVSIPFRMQGVGPKGR